MALTSMKLSKSQKKRMFGPYPSVAGNSLPDFPYGLTINLDSAALKKLGVDELPDAGEECVIHAVGKVVNVSSSASDKATERSVSIQITKMQLECEDTDDSIYEKAKRDRKAKM